MAGVKQLDVKTKKPGELSTNDVGGYVAALHLQAVMAKTQRQLVGAVQSCVATESVMFPGADFSMSGFGEDWALYGQLSLSEALLELGGE